MSSIKIICSNRKASFNYQLDAKMEAGISLQGTEVKSLRLGKANLNDAYGDLSRGEVYLLNCHISEYTHGNRENHEPLRRRKLLLHRHEIDKLKSKIKERGFSLVPTKMYFKKGRVKVEIALGKGKTKGDKRNTIKDRESKRKLAQVTKIKR